MLQVGGGHDLSHEPLGAEYRRGLGMKHLDGDLARVADVALEVDGGHAAATEFAVEGVAVGESAGEAAGDGSHGPQYAEPPGQRPDLLCRFLRGTRT